MARRKIKAKPKSKKGRVGRVRAIRNRRGPKTLQPLGENQVLTKILEERHALEKAEEKKVVEKVKDGLVKLEKKVKEEKEQFPPAKSQARPPPLTPSSSVGSPPQLESPPSTPKRHGRIPGERIETAIQRHKRNLIAEIKKINPRSNVDMGWSIDELRERLAGLQLEFPPSGRPKKYWTPVELREAKEAQTETVDPDEAGSDIDDEDEQKILAYGEEGSTGNGVTGGRGLSNFQIDEIMKRVPYYLGTIAHDELKTKIIPQVKPKSKGAVIINTDPASKGGRHWQAIQWDARPVGDASIEFYDSFGDEMDPRLRRDIKELADKLDAGKYLKLKENKVQKQNDRSSNCGYFCVKFILDRARGKPFPEASGYNDSIKGEGEIEKFKGQNGFGYIASFHEGAGWFDVYKTWPVPLQKWMDQNIKITSLAVCRKPIDSKIEGVLNLISLGQFSKAKSESGYDKMFHLYIYVNNTWALERNETVQINPITPDSQTELVPLEVGSRNITSKSLLEMSLGWAFNPPRRATREQALAQINRYDPLRNNCQDFVLAVLRGQGLLTPKLQAWIKQDTSLLIQKLPSVTQKIAGFTTDLANRARRFLGWGQKKD